MKNTIHKEFIDWASEIKKLNYAKYASNITIADVADNPAAAKAIDDLMTVGNFKADSNA